MGVRAGGESGQMALHLAAINVLASACLGKNTPAETVFVSCCQLLSECGCAICCRKVYWLGGVAVEVLYLSPTWVCAERAARTPGLLQSPPALLRDRADAATHKPGQICRLSVRLVASSIADIACGVTRTRTATTMRYPP
eukprot:3694341-Rhodomonas_salina.1